MRSFLLLAAALVAVAAPAFPATHTVTSSGFTFSPSTLNIQEGDTVVFSLSFDHNAVEVSQTTWNSNGSAPLAGGFSRGFGGGTVIGLTAGTHYYVCQPHASGGMKGRIIVSPVTDVRPVAGAVPAAFALSQGYPNPFNPSTSFRFSVARTSFTTIAVYDGIGRRVATLVAETLPAGEYAATWEGTRDDGAPAVSGPYFVRMSAGGGGRDYFAVRKVLLVR